MNNKGFTLIELIGVIVIVAAIALIAIPEMLSVVNYTKKSAMVKEENILIKATTNYLSANTNLIPANTGDTTTVLYSTLKSNGYSSLILDSSAKNECTNSKIFITKLASGALKYTPGLICDNYISIDTFDMLGGIGKYFTDVNTDGVADGWILEGSGTSTNTLDTTIKKSHTSSQKILSLTLNRGLSFPAPYYKTIESGKKYYVFANVISTTNYTFILGSAAHYDGNYGSVPVTISTSWKLCSRLFTATTNQLYMYSTQTGTT